jgi:hypothetical protein
MPKQQMPTQQWLAIFLAIGGMLWGLFCLPFLLLGDPLRTIPTFGPGYVVTFGYLVRAIYTPSIRLRVGIWLLSALVQGAWLLWSLSGVLTGEYFSDYYKAFIFGIIILVWWAFAFAASVYGIFTDRFPRGATQGAGPARLNGHAS